eukprot:Hpha_TRINITY_DN34119_c0_g1::TRINITY_DN34119_c0_g1_i1::g.75948::m.75948
MGRDPEMELLDEHGARVSGLGRVPLSNLDEEGIEEILRRHTITRESPKAVFRPRTFEPVGDCLAWRKTGDCRQNGPREPEGDASCANEVASDASGYCECTEGIAVGVDCSRYGSEKWAKHFTEMAGWVKDDQTVWVEPRGQEGWKAVHNLRRAYYFNTKERVSSWDPPPDWKEPRKSFTCSEVCGSPEKLSELPGLRRRDVAELKRLEQTRKQDAQPTQQDAAVTELGHPSTWPTTHL